MRKEAKVYDAAQGVEGMTPKITKMNHKKCSPQEFGRMVKEAGPRFDAFARALRGAGNRATQSVPVIGAIGGGAAGYGMAGESATDKLEGTIAGGLVGLGGGSFANPAGWRNVHLKAKADAAALAGTRVGKSRMSGDYWGPALKHMTKDLIVPKLTFISAGAATPLVRQVGKSVEDISAMTSNARQITEDAARLQGDLSKTDAEGKSVADLIREAVTQVAEDSKSTSTAVAEGAQNVSANLSNATEGLNNTSGAVGRVADSLDRLTGPMADEWTQRDAEGKTPISNLNTLLSNLSKWTSPDSVTPIWAATMEGVRKYGPTAAGVGAGGLGLYALYKYMMAREKNKKRREPEPKFAADKTAANVLGNAAAAAKSLFRSPAAAGRSAMMQARRQLKPVHPIFDGERSAYRGVVNPDYTPAADAQLRNQFLNNMGNRRKFFNLPDSAQYRHTEPHTGQVIGPGTAEDMQEIKRVNSVLARRDAAAKEFSRIALPFQIPRRDGLNKVVAPAGQQAAQSQLMKQLGFGAAAAGAAGYAGGQALLPNKTR